MKKMLFDLTTFFFFLFACSHVFALLLNNIILFSFCLYWENWAFILIWMEGGFRLRLSARVRFTHCVTHYSALFLVKPSIGPRGQLLFSFKIVTQSLRKVDINLTVNPNRIRMLSFGVVWMKEFFVIFIFYFCPLKIRVTHTPRT